MSERTTRHARLPGGPARRGDVLLFGLLGVGLLVSALLVVKTKHENRRLVNELAELRVDRERLDTEWSQLQLEEATLAHHGRVEQIAREKLSMTDPKDVVVVPVQGQARP
jgi:cell division protein FtsL